MKQDCTQGLAEWMGMNLDRQYSCQHIQLLLAIPPSQQLLYPAPFISVRHSLMYEYLTVFSIYIRHCLINVVNNVILSVPPGRGVPHMQLSTHVFSPVFPHSRWGLGAEDVTPCSAPWGKLWFVNIGYQIRYIFFLSVWIWHVVDVTFSLGTLSCTRYRKWMDLWI